MENQILSQTVPSDFFLNFNIVRVKIMLLCNLKKMAASHYVSGTQWNLVLKAVQRNEKQTTKLKMVYNEQIKMQLHTEVQTCMGYANANLLRIC